MCTIVEVYVEEKHAGVVRSSYRMQMCLGRAIHTISVMMRATDGFLIDLMYELQVCWAVALNKAPTNASTAKTCVLTIFEKTKLMAFCNFDTRPSHITTVTHHSVSS